MDVRECIICYEPVVNGQEEDFGCKEYHVSHRSCVDLWYKSNPRGSNTIKCGFCKSVSKRKRKKSISSNKFEPTLFIYRIVITLLHVIMAAMILMIAMTAVICCSSVLRDVLVASNTSLFADVEPINELALLIHDYVNLFIEIIDVYRNIIIEINK